MNSWHDLLRKYHKVWQHYWVQRSNLDSSLKLNHEAEFLPATQALQEIPVHPAPRIIQKIIMILFAFTILWSCLGKIDVVASATGKVVPNGKSKIVQSSTVAEIASIYVQDGQYVKEGDVLIELNPSLTRADIARIQNELNAANIDIARAKSLLFAIENKSSPQITSDLFPDLNNQDIASSLLWVNGQYLELTNLLAQSDATIRQKQAEIKANQTAIKGLIKIIPISMQLAQDYKKVFEEQGTSKHSWLEKEQMLLEQQDRLKQHQSKKAELKAQLSLAQLQAEGIIHQYRKAMLDLLNDANKRQINLEQELKKAKRQNELMYLTAPITGTVQQLAINTIGGVVTEAQPLLVIVPQEHIVEVEAILPNKDIGFVQVGQEVEVKIETFNFTKYGVIDGIVTNIAQDAQEDENLGLVYNMRVQLKKDQILVGSNWIKLMPGMAVTAEVKTAKRRIIEYFLSPLKQHVQESLRER